MKTLDNDKIRRKKDGEMEPPEVWLFWLWERRPPWPDIVRTGWTWCVWKLKWLEAVAKSAHFCGTSQLGESERDPMSSLKFYVILILSSTSFVHSKRSGTSLPHCCLVFTGCSGVWIFKIAAQKKKNHSALTSLSQENPHRHERDYKLSVQPWVNITGSSWNLFMLNLS